MLEQFDFVNLDGIRYQFNTDTVPLNHLSFESEVRSSHRAKAQAHGTWAGHTYIGACIVHMDGEILEQNSTDFTSTKMSILNTVMPNPLTFRDEFPLGRLEVRLTGMSEAAQGDCTIDGDIAIPMEGLSPSRAPISITWVVFKGYFTGLSSGSPYWIK